MVMACCGQRREALVSGAAKSTLARAIPMMASYNRGVSAASSQVSRPAVVAPTVPARPIPVLAGVAPAAMARAASGATAASPGGALGGMVNLRYLARSAIVVRGPATGAQYHFSAAQPVQRVARADRDALLR